MEVQIQSTHRRTLFAMAVITSLCISGMLAVRAADATPYYVATTGSDANAGTASLPFNTITKGVSRLQPGDTLYVRAGTYAETLYCPSGYVAPGYVCIPSGTSWNYPVTVAAYPGETVTIKPTSGLRVLNFNNTQAYIIINGFIIDGANVGNHAIQIQGAAHHIRIQSCEIKNSPSSGIHISPGNNYNEVLDNHIHDVKTLAAQPTHYEHGLYIESSNNLIRGNTIHHCSGYGVHIFNGNSGTSANANSVYKNRVYSNGLLTPSNAAGILLSSGSNNLAYDNLIWGNPVGIKIAYGAVNSWAFNNTVYANTASQGQVGIYVMSDSTGASVINNIAYQNGANILNQGTGTTLATNLTVNPGFVDPVNLNFTLQAGSPAINTGSSLSQVTEDFVGLARPQGFGYDIGAYESH